MDGIDSLMFTAVLFAAFYILTLLSKDNKKQ